MIAAVILAVLIVLADCTMCIRLFDVVVSANPDLCLFYGLKLLRSVVESAVFAVYGHSLVGASALLMRLLLV